MCWRTKLCGFSVVIAELLVHSIVQSTGSAGEFDYVVVGAGSAGSVAAAHLVHWSPLGTTVALLDAGLDQAWLQRTPDPNRDEIQQSALWYRYIRACDDVEGYCSSCQAEGCLVQGKVLGGGAAVNGQVYTHPVPGDLPMFPADAVRTASTNLESAIPRVLLSPTWEEMGPRLQVFVTSLESAVPNLHWRLEPNVDGGSTARISGHLRSLSTSPGKVQSRRFASAQTLSKLQGDGDLSRVTPYWHLVADEKRNAQSLRVFANTSARRVLLDDVGRAIGVEAFGPDGTVVFGARQEVLLSSGALGTPQLLFASGLGPWPGGVGAGGVFPLQDQRFFWLSPVTVGNVPCPAAWEGSSDHEGRDIHVYLNVSSATTRSREASAEFELWVAERCCEGEVYCLAIGLVLLHPTSWGRFRAGGRKGAKGNGRGRSSRPDYALTTQERDLASFRSAVRLVRDVASRAAARMAVEIEGAQRSGPLPFRTDPLLSAEGAALDYMLRVRIAGFWHPMGTCPVGQVVDRHLRVVGTPGLRIADNSVIAGATGHTDGPAQVLGYLAAAEMTGHRIHSDRD